MIVPRELNHQRHFAGQANKQNGAWNCIKCRIETNIFFKTPTKPQEETFLDCSKIHPDIHARKSKMPAHPILH